MSEQSWLVDSLEASTEPTVVEWDQWVRLPSPLSCGPFRSRPVAERFERNGFAWDIHGTLLEPDREHFPGLALVMFHGGAGSEWEALETPDGRPGIARVAASLGIKVLALTYVGHYPAGSTWQLSVAERTPVYLLDTAVPMEEIRRRNLACTLNVTLAGAATLVERHLKDHRLLTFGHSTGGPMAVMLHSFLPPRRVAGVVGWGSGGPTGWRLAWRRETGAEPEKHEDAPLDGWVTRSAGTFERQDFVDDPELTPWGGNEAYTGWADRHKSQMKTALCAHQHQPNPELLERYPALTGLPADEYLNVLQDPDPDWLRGRGILLLVGEKDRGHWQDGGPWTNRELYSARRYLEAGARPKVIVVPRYRHFGFVALHNERIVHAWLWALRMGFFT